MMNSGYHLKATKHHNNRLRYVKYFKNAQQSQTLNKKNNMKNLKNQVLPMAIIIALSLFASKSLLDKNGGGLNVTALQQTQKPDPKDDPGWSILQHRLIFPPKAHYSTNGIAKQHELLARYQE